MFVLEAIGRIQEQKGNGYNANVNDGFMNTIYDDSNTSDTFCPSC